jgi:hypothetical protein
MQRSTQEQATVTHPAATPVRPTRAVPWLAAALVAGALALAGCGAADDTADPTATTPGNTLTSAASAEAGSTASAGATPSSGPATASPSAEPVAAEWKTFQDAGKTISFDLPKEWTAQADDAAAAGETKIEVRNADGDVMATFDAAKSVLGGACQPKSARPYTVLASIPLSIPSDNTGSTAVAPRFVYRLIKGSAKFYASYGITDRAGGTDGKACLVYNVVSSKALGNYMFGDVLQFTSALDGTPGLRAFDTIADAQKYMLTSEFQNVQKMITSLKVAG